MWPFKNASEPSNLDMIMKNCNFKLARDEFADFFSMINQQDKASGEQTIFRQELVTGWEMFSHNPTEENANKWLLLMGKDQDLILKTFIACCPGGQIAGRVALCKPQGTR